MPEITKRLDRAEVAKRVERAEKLLQKGKTAEALEDYLLVLRDDPENDVVRQLAADLCLSLGRNPEAVRLLGELFERQVGTGDATRASLTYKKLARHGSPTWQQKFRFGQLLEGSNKKLAVGTYEAALSDLAKLGKKQEAAEILSRIVALEPIQANFLRVAELASESGDRKVAAAAYQRVAQLTAAEGGDAAQWYERAYQEDASDQSIALAYGKSLLTLRQEREERVGWLVAAGFDVGRGDERERFLLDRQVGVDVGVGGADVRVSQPEGDDGGVDAGLQERHRAAVAEDVRVQVLGR